MDFGDRAAPKEEFLPLGQREKIRKNMRKKIE